MMNDILFHLTSFFFTNVSISKGAIASWRHVLANMKSFVLGFLWDFCSEFVMSVVFFHSLTISILRFEILSKE